MPILSQSNSPKLANLMLKKGSQQRHIEV